MNFLLWFFVAYASLSVLADAVTTTLCLEHALAEKFGVYEANPISAFGFQRFGMIRFLIFDSLVRIGVLFWLALSWPRVRTWVKVVAMAAVGTLTYAVSYNNYSIYLMLER